MKVFWSWQSDTPAKLNKEFVKQALNAALEQVSADLQLSEAERPEVDHDTKGEAGLVEIVATIFKKIEESEVFVGDVTFVGQTAAEKKLPNPNVMIELGHALTSRGAERIILVANAAFGFKPEDLPFDLRHRRAPITYSLAEGATRDERKTARSQLTKALKEALLLNLGAALKAKSAATIFNLHPAHPDDRSIWLAPDEPIRHQDSFSGVQREWNVPRSPHYYMRLAPSDWPKSFSRMVVLEKSGGLWALGPMISADEGANNAGFAKVTYRSRSEDTTTALGVTQWFKDTGEIWGVSWAACFERDGRLWIAHPSIASEWKKYLRAGLEFFKKLGASGPFRVEAGIFGLDELYWADEWDAPTMGLDREVVLARTHRSWDPADQIDFLHDLYNQLHDAFGKAHLGPEEMASRL